MTTELVSEMTREELRQLIDDTLEEKLIELLGDPDEGLLIRDSIRKRLLRNRSAVKKGERGRSLKDVAQELRLDE